MVDNKPALFQELQAIRDKVITKNLAAAVGDCETQELHIANST